MHAVLDEIDLYRATGITEHAFAIHTGHCGAFAGLLQRVGGNAVAIGKDAFQVGAGLGADNDFCAFGHCGAQASGVVKVVV